VRSIGRHGYHHIFYRDWGDPAGMTAFCVHGLSRNNHDFDAFARVLSRRRRVVCPDLAGRGHVGAVGLSQLNRQRTALRFHWRAWCGLHPGERE
jgi:pimeloyl-ACP methyl ester carboxylesterase